MQDNKRKIKIYVYAGLMICLLVVIFIFSNQVGDLSYSISNRVYSLFENTPIGSLLNKIEISKGLSIRKDAHIILYCFLGVLSSLFFMALCKRMSMQILFSVLFCYAAAAFDEWHQTFVPDRNGRLKDIGVDSIGFLSAILIVYLIRWLFLFVKNQQHKGENV